MSSPSGSGDDGAGPSEPGRASTSGTDGPPPWQRGSGSTGRSSSDGPASGGSGGIDAPTSQISRADIPSDMPDLSAAPRTSRPAESRAGEDSRPRRPAGAVNGGGRGPRRASLQIKHVDPWSTLKLSLVLSIALFLVWMIAVGILYLVLDGLDVWDRINETFSDFVTVSDPRTTADPLIGPQQVFSVAGIIGLVNIVLFTALTTVSSFVYNISSDLAGGVELTLTERD